MSKQENRGWQIHGFPKCFNCCCSVCTRRRCIYPAGSTCFRNRCAGCQTGLFNLPCFECDFFENKYTVPRRFHFKINRRKKGEIEKRLDAIMQAVGAELPPDDGGKKI